jgi:hypothetical protein
MNYRFIFKFLALKKIIFKSSNSKNPKLLWERFLYYCKLNMKTVDLKIGIKSYDRKYLGDQNLLKYFIWTKNEI